jgi:hypothetical protein
MKQPAFDNPGNIGRVSISAVMERQRLGPFGGAYLLAQLLLALVVIGVCLVFILIILYCIFIAYPRFFTIGYTEGKFESYVVDYVKEVLTYLRKIKNAPPSKTGDRNKPVDDAITKFFEMYNSTFNTDAPFDIGDEKAALVINSGALYLYMIIMFYHDIEKGRRKGVNYAFEHLKSKLDSKHSVKLQKMYESEEKLTELKDDEYEKLVNLYKKFKDVRDAVKSRVDGIDYFTNDIIVEDLDILMLDVLLNKYLKKKKGDYMSNYIVSMYRMRQTGGFGNFGMMLIYIEDQTYYVFKEKIYLQYWKPFITNAKGLALKIQKKMASDSVTNWFVTLPQKFAGKEGFTQKKINQIYENFITENPYKTDVTEPFVGELLKIAKTFVSMFTVITSIINVITDPVAFIKFLIGYIVAIILYMIYFILYNIFFFVAVGYVVRVLVCTFMTLWWFIQWLAFALIFVAIAIIDFPLGGAIMRSLRCENLPNAWHTTPNWHRENMNMRSLFCNRKCRKRFYANGPHFCKRQSKDEPAYAPQQVIFNTLRKVEYMRSTSEKLIYSRKPNMKYFLSYTDSDKELLWREVFQAQMEYMSETDRPYEKYNKINISYCKFINASYDEKVMPKDVHDKLKQLCVTAFCRDADNCKLEFCKERPPNATPALLDTPEAKSVDLVKTILAALIIIAALVVVIMLIMRYTS